jgi:hypothetical protein
MAASARRRLIGDPPASAGAGPAMLSEGPSNPPGAAIQSCWATISPPAPRDRDQAEPRKRRRLLCRSSEWRDESGCRARSGLSLESREFGIS